jgi:hypothetical protein
MNKKPEKWIALSSDKFERDYKGYQLVVQQKKATTKKIEYEDDFHLWKWIILNNNLVVESGYEDSYEEATKTSEFVARELEHDKQ